MISSCCKHGGGDDDLSGNLLEIGVIEIEISVAPCHDDPMRSTLLHRSRDEVVRVKDNLQHGAAPPGVVVELRTIRIPLDTNTITPDQDTCSSGRVQPVE
jgi:hypothetical protein